jgi:predicted transcriptional regulator
LYRSFKYGEIAMAITSLEEKPPFPVYSLVQVESKATLLHRSRFDIMATILLAANEGGTRKTHIMYKCNLSFKQLHAYLRFLVEMGLLRPIVENVGTDDSSCLFQTTRKGEAFIKAYGNLNALLTKNSK